MNDETTDHTEAMLAALRRVRRRVRALLIVEAAGRMVAWGILIAGLLAVLDWWVHFPWFVRVNFFGVGIVFAAIWLYRDIWRPLMAPIHLDQLALGLSSLPANLKDRLAGTVAYLQSGGEGSPELWKRVVHETIRSAEDLPSRGVLRARPAMRSMFSAGGAVMTVAIAAWLAPHYVSMGATRLARPLSGADWPKATQIFPLTTDAVVAWGEAFTAQMRMDRGDRASLRAYLTWSSSPHQRQREQMRRDPDGVYRFTLENIRSSLTYSFSAGDDDTAVHPFTVRVVRRPSVASTKLKLTPPPYAKHLPVQTRILDDAPIIALRGSTARFEVTPDRPIGQSGSSRAALILDGATRVPLTSTDESRDALIAEFQVEKDGSVESELVDADGLESRGGAVHRIQIRQDEPPHVAIQQPSGTTGDADRGVEIRALARDDVGLAAFSLLASRHAPEFQPIVDLLSTSRAVGASSSSGSGPPLRCDVSHTWLLETLGAAPGDVIRYYVEARDGYEMDGRTHEPVRSPVMTINVISPAQLADRLRSDLLAVRGPLRELLTELLAATEGTKRLDEKPATDQVLDAKDRQTVEALAERIQRLTANGRQTAEKIEDVIRKAARNGATTSESAREAAQLARRLKGSTNERMKEASQSLARAGESRKPGEQHEHLKASKTAQEESASSLQSMLDEVERWSDFEELVRKLRDVLDRQEALARETATLAKNFGRSVGEPDDSSLPTLMARASASQAQLRADAVALIQSMRTWAQKREESDSAASFSVEAAARVAEEKSLAAAMDEAAQAVAEARFGRAQEVQRESANALRAMLAALEQKPDRELADLSRAIQDLTARLRKIIKVQEDLIGQTAATGEAPDASEKLQGLADRQSTLQKTTGALAMKVKDADEDASAAKRAIVASSIHMGKAGEMLEGLLSAEAQTAQHDALEGLNKALELLEHLEARTEQAIAERSLAQIVALLAELRRSQAALRGETAEIHARAGSDRRLSRADSLKVARLAKEQRGLTTPLQEAREKLQASVVYSYVCEKIGGQMETAAVRLEDKDCKSALESQDTVLAELAGLLDAAMEAPKKDAARFVEDSGGGGAGNPTPDRPVPTLAELKVLRRLQTDVSNRTAALDRSRPDPLLRSESQLKEIEVLGKSQQDIHELAVKMIEKSSQKKEE